MVGNESRARPARETAGKKIPCECKSTASWLTGRNENCDEPAVLTEESRDRRSYRGPIVTSKTRRVGVDDPQMRGDP